MGQNKSLKALRKRKDFDLLRQQAFSFSSQWLKALFLDKKETETLSLSWSLPKKYIPHAVTRNRLKRWGRENLKKSSLRGFILMIFFSRDKVFYKDLKRKEFDYVFYSVLEKILEKN